MKRHAIIAWGTILFCSVLGMAQEQTDAKQQEEVAEQTSEAKTAPEEEIDGQALFKQYCTACHHPTQRLVGPALQGVRERRDSAWIVQFVRASQSMVEAGDSTAQAMFMDFNQVPMPDHKHLSPAQINAIIDYVNIPEEEVAGTKQPITRPEMPAQVQYQPLEFSSFTFWLIYTAMVFMIIGWLFYMIEYTEIVKKATEGKEGSDQVPFGEQD